MKKVLSFFAAFMLLGAFAPQVLADDFDFYATAPSGQTLYYKIMSDGVSVCLTHPYNNFYNPWSGYSKPTGNLVIPSTVTNNGSSYSVITIDSSAFRECTSLTSVTIPNSVISIGNTTFYGCTGLTSIIIPNSVTSIGESVFSLCTGLTSISIPNSVTSIGPSAFSGCTSLTSITIPNGVTSLGNYIFSGCTGLNSITIPNSVISIGERAFRGCTGLTSITIPNSVNNIGWALFEDCGNLATVYFNADSCLSESSELSDDGIRYCINNHYNPFFAGCSSLTNIFFGNNVKYIPEFFCFGLSGLTSVVLPDSLRVVGDWAFYDCSVLTSITLGRNVATIGCAAFCNCTNLTEIHSLNPIAPQLGTYTLDGQIYEAFHNVPSTIPVHIPCGSSNSYYSRWNYFSNFIEEEGFTFTATSDNEQQGTVQILTMPTCTSPQAVVYATAISGYHFDYWSDGSTSNPYSLTVTDDLNLVAFFAADGSDGIGDIDADGIRIYAADGCIVVEGTDGEAVTVYDMTGRNVCNDDLPNGIYMVKVGNHLARKVVVIR